MKNSMGAKKNQFYIINTDHLDVLLARSNANMYILSDSYQRGGEPSMQSSALLFQEGMLRNHPVSLGAFGPRFSFSSSRWSTWLFRAKGVEFSLLHKIRSLP